MTERRDHDRDKGVSAPGPGQDPDATVAGPNETVPSPLPSAKSSPDATRPVGPVDSGSAASSSRPIRETPPSSSESSSPPEKIGEYLIEAELGRGGMGIVYRALDPRLRRPVALKVLTGAVGGNPVAFEKFEREAQTLAALNHPNIATIFSLDEAGGSPFFTME